MSICDRAKKEVIDFHEFLVEVFTGKYVGDPILRLSAFDENFCYVPPDGGSIDLAALRNIVPEWHNSEANIKIFINILQSYELNENTCVVLYEEQQVDATEGDNKRITTAIFQANSLEPTGVKWRHVHESWLST